ncbi:MAG: response regulator transcription factor [Actinomycetota bacterium]|nr:response regulator transcription factor [Actinomycetota bacterium]
MVTVLIGDSDPVSRARTRELVAGDPRFSVCAEAVDAPSAVAQALAQQPMVCLLDVDMPGGGIAAASEIHARLPEAKIVMLAGESEDRVVVAALRAGASGFLLRDAPMHRLSYALWDAFHGKAAMPRAVMARVIALFEDSSPTWKKVLSNTGSPLSTREWQVVALLAEGRETTEVAARLSVSPATVRSHRARARRKLRASGNEPG